MTRITLTEMKEAPLGFGCMSLTTIDQAVEIIYTAYQNGVRYFDSAAIYGEKPGDNERLLGQAIQVISKKYDKDFREKVFIATKGGIHIVQGKLRYNGKKEFIKVAIEESLKNLGTDYIDVFYLHRVDPETPIIECINTIAEYISLKKIRYIGLSEVDVNTIVIADTIHFVQFIENEFSPWHREDEFGENSLLNFCHKHNKIYIAYSPLARGFFTHANQTFFSSLPMSDFRRSIPRYVPPLIKHNLEQRKPLENLAKKHKVSLVVLTLAWIIDKGRLLHISIIPIPGTHRISVLREYLQALTIEFTSELRNEFNHVCRSQQFQGSRVPLSLDNASKGIGITDAKTLQNRKLQDSNHLPRPKL